LFSDMKQPNQQKSEIINTDSLEKVNDLNQSV